MLNPAALAAPGAIVYPESDGLPMSDNTRQFRWIVTLAGNLAALFRDRDDVFVSGNQFWYPVEGRPDIHASPDVYAVFGRPKGDRPSYKQWEEGNVPMTVVFEVRSPRNTDAEMAAKLDFYDEHGVEEYYDFDPDANRLRAYRRGAATLASVGNPHNYVSPRLGIRFDLSSPELVVRYPDGEPFLTFEEIAAARRRDKLLAEQEKQRADQEKRRADLAEQRAARLAELSRKALQQQATPEELQELQRLWGTP